MLNICKKAEKEAVFINSLLLTKMFTIRYFLSKNFSLLIPFTLVFPELHHSGRLPPRIL